MGLNREQLLAQARPKIIEVPVPEWGGTIHLRDITAGQRDQYDGYQIDQQGQQKYTDFRARLLILSICDQDGNRLFTDSEVSTISSLPAHVVDRLWDQAALLCGLKTEQVEKN